MVYYKIPDVSCKYHPNSIEVLCYWCDKEYKHEDKVNLIRVKCACPQKGHWYCPGCLKASKFKNLLT